mgnify:FL=1
MTKIIYNKFDKKKIGELPRVLFEGKIVVVLSVSEADKAVKYLLSRDILGIDTETRPMFHKGEHHKVALLQVSDHDTCFLFRLNRIGMPRSIISFLEDTTVPKIGLSLNDDILMLHQRANFKKGNFIDLQDHVKELGIEDLSLQKLYANIFHQRISKREQLSNWENDVLTEPQKRYAATDAWACINLYEEMRRLKESGGYELVNTSEAQVKEVTK